MTSNTGDDANNTTGFYPQVEKEIVMKRFATLSFLAAVCASGAAFAQFGDMQGMGMQGMDMNRCMAMHGMDMKACQDMMKGMDSKSQGQATSKKGAVHKTSAVVKAVDPVNGKVTLAHGPVPSLKWPAMSMAFTVKDKSLFDMLKVGQTVDVEFTQQGSDFVVTAAK